jgi:hypothetical protein
MDYLLRIKSDSVLSVKDVEYKISDAIQFSDNCTSVGIEVVKVQEPLSPELFEAVFLSMAYLSDKLPEDGKVPFRLLKLKNSASPMSLSQIFKRILSVIPRDMSVSDVGPFCDRFILSISEVKKYRYSASTPVIWTDFDSGEILARGKDEARKLAIAKMTECLRLANEKLSPLGLEIGMSLDEVEIEEIKE